MTHAASLTDWAAYLSLGTSISAAVSIPVHLFVDAERSDFNPRPMLLRALESGRLDPLLNVACNAKADTRAAVAWACSLPRDAAISLAALLMLLSPNPEATR
ncbi:hypothetical protein ACH4UM_18605 [Streptomyces sp. NPDC020801]|uniref:hypothetical protein n=1 Tax=Streptomyces sp. NPDC020801 TaxID=3365093 RepID=UPI0037B02F23